MDGESQQFPMRKNGYISDRECVGGVCEAEDIAGSVGLVRKITCRAVLHTNSLITVEVEITDVTGPRDVVQRVPRWTGIQAFPIKQVHDDRSRLALNTIGGVGYALPTRGVADIAGKGMFIKILPGRTVVEAVSGSIG